MPKVTNVFLEKRYKEMLNYESFLVQLVELLKGAGEPEVAALICKEKNVIKSQRLDLKMTLERQKRHVG
ncbi:hypothetical protein JOC94_004202 [Bacillus thermophilus]|uniref:Uncharacterized protein n=1 Tax=Siminovitchia thermophila TaxID=1245522 RepID=A0ABS2RBY7_9BACI|nr:hypothetical protein [Siminovitchia thermophila]MBM7717177.1 hypothetical protein [Siminovitchia thermophila]